MTTLCIQIQPDRVAQFDQAAVEAVCDALRIHKPLISAFQLEAGEDDGPYLNLMFETEDAQALWPILQTAFYPASPFGDMLRATSMAMCTGEEGWDDFLLLYHYDDNLQLDSLAD